jgi:peptidoglycan/xylan/chitin deacetylase (PgdA/CDA1 family)
MKNAFILNLLKPLATIASGLGKEKKLLIMIYHRVLDEPDFMRPGEVDKEAFTWQMELLAKHFNVLHLSEALERMQNDTLPSRAVSITFDDGYADNFTNALPILKKFNLTATFFIANGFLNGGRMWNDIVIESIRNIQGPILDLTEIGLDQFVVTDELKKSQTASQIISQIKYLPVDERDNITAFIAAQSQDLPNDLMMTCEQLKLLHQSGMEIGGHTVNHPILARLEEKNAKREIAENKAILEQLIGIEIKVFAYPNGKLNMDYLQQQTVFVKDAGFIAAVSTKWGVATKNCNLFQLPRFTPWDNSEDKFMVRLIYQYWLAGL